MAASAGNDDVNLVRPAEDRGEIVRHAHETLQDRQESTICPFPHLDHSPERSSLFDLHNPSFVPAGGEGERDVPGFLLSARAMERVDQGGDADNQRLMSCMLL
jgi:hypothetical protein